jgi:hypothetical protein
LQYRQRKFHRLAIPYRRGSGPKKGKNLRIAAKLLIIKQALVGIALRRVSREESQNHASTGVQRLPTGLGRFGQGPSEALVPAIGC